MPPKETGKEAYFVKSMKEYEDIQHIKRGEKVWVIKDTATELVYGRFAEDTTPQKLNAWDVYDVLYADVARSYETGLYLLAQDKHDEARDMFNRCSEEKTLGGTIFAKTDAYRNYIDEKLLHCALGKDDKAEAERLFKRIGFNKNAHSHVRVMIQYISFLNQQGDGGGIAIQIVDDLLKMQLPVKTEAEISLEKMLAMAHQKKFNEAKSGIKQVAEKYQKSVPGIDSMCKKLLTDIVIDVEKNYPDGARLLKEELNGKERPSSDLYRKLGDCHGNANELPEARWYYIQAYLSESDESKLDRIATSITKLNKQIGANGSEEIEQYLQSAKALHDKKKK